MLSMHSHRDDWNEQTIQKYLIVHKKKRGCRTSRQLSQILRQLPKMAQHIMLNIINIFKEKELENNTTVKFFLTVQQE